MEDVHRAGGIHAILGQLERQNLLHTDNPTVHSPTIGESIEQWDTSRNPSDAVKQFFMAAPGRVRSSTAFSQDKRWDLDLDRESGVVRDFENAHMKDGGLAVLYGNIATDGCIVKTAGVPKEILKFSGPARIFESQDAACAGILGGEVEEGDVVVIRYEGPKGGPGMQEMLYPTSYLKSTGIDKGTALVTDGRFSGATAGLCLGHISPEAAEGGAIGLVENGDIIQIDIPARGFSVDLTDEELAERREKMEALGPQAWTPRGRNRVVSGALRAYAALTTSAARGAVRDVSQTER